MIALVFSWLESKAIDEKHLRGSLQSSGKGTGKQLKKSTSHSLIGLQICLSVLILTASSQVLLQSLAEAYRDTQINSEGKWELTLDFAEIESQKERQNTHRAIRQQLIEQGIVQAVTYSSEKRLPEPLNYDRVFDQDSNLLTNSRLIDVEYNYLEQFELDIEGRFFDKGEHDLAHPPIIINQRLAALVGAKAIGSKLRFASGKGYTVIGIVENTNFPGASFLEVAEAYFPATYQGRRFSYLLLGSVTEDLHHQVLALVKQIDSRVEVKQLQPVDELFKKYSFNTRFAALLSGVVSFTALLMVLAGIFGMVSYMVRLRQFDLGVSIAMGATNSIILKEQLLDLLKPAAAALLLAFSLSFFFIGYTRNIPELVFDVYWGSLFFVLLLIGSCCFIAFIIPVWLILKTEPVKALKNG